MKTKIQKLQEKLTRALKEEYLRKSRQMFQCSCGKMHAINHCTVIQTHWYTQPRGCCEGDYWNTGELRIICPTTKVRNRVMFEQRSDIAWEKRQDFKYNPEAQFSANYRSLFKGIIEDHDEDKGATFNNYYFDKNHKKFGISIGDI